MHCAGKRFRRGINSAFRTAVSPFLGHRYPRSSSLRPYSKTRRRNRIGLVGLADRAVSVRSHRFNIIKHARGKNDRREQTWKVIFAIFAFFNAERLGEAVSLYQKIASIQISLSSSSFLSTESDSLI